MGAPAAGVRAAGIAAAPARGPPGAAAPRPSWDQRAPSGGAGGAGWGERGRSETPRGGVGAGFSGLPPILPAGRSGSPRLPVGRCEPRALPQGTPSARHRVSGCPGAVPAEKRENKMLILMRSREGSARRGCCAQGRPADSRALPVPVPPRGRFCPRPPRSAPVLLFHLMSSGLGRARGRAALGCCLAGGTPAGACGSLPRAARCPGCPRCRPGPAPPLRTAAWRPMP